VSATDRLGSERAFHDRQAGQRSAYFSGRPEELLVDSSSYLDHETWIRPALAQLGDVRGLCVLDYGCGHGMATVVLARRGARVTAFDLSAGYVAEAKTRARANRLPIDFVQTDGERLPFSNESFDRVWGNAVLHHLDLGKAGKELHRVLRPGGIAVFCEPWGENLVLNWARSALPYPGKHRTIDERPLCPGDVRLLRTMFADVELRGYQLLSMLRRVLRPGRLVASLGRCDDLLLKRVPGLQRFCRYVVLTLRRR
jgi:SAM-dependent methyltransferase